MDAYHGVRGWWRIRNGLDQWPEASGPYYQRWLEVRGESEPDYYTWLAEQKQWHEPWATWAKEHAEAIGWRDRRKDGKRDEDKPLEAS